MKKYLLFCLLTNICVFFNGCKTELAREVPETEEKLFQQAQQFLKEGRPQDAFQAFSNLLEKRKDAPETHLEMGRLYLSLHNDPLFAICHFRQYLLLEPQGKLAPMALQMIETAKKEFARTLPLNDTYVESPEYLNLMEVLKQVRKENTQLKEHIAQLTTQAKTKATTQVSPAATTTGTSSPTAAGETTYVVQGGDTLSKISLKVYGTTKHWQQIFEANKDILHSPNSLKIGMKLRIPSRG